MKLPLNFDEQVKLFEKMKPRGLTLKQLKKKAEAATTQQERDMYLQMIVDRQRAPKSQS